MTKLARLMDDLRAVRRGELAFDSVTGRVSSHLTSWPDEAEDVLQQVETALAQRIIEPDEFHKLRTVIVDTIHPRKPVTDPLRSSPVSARREAEAEALRSARPRQFLGLGPVSRSAIELGTRLRDRFILDEVLGSGGMGTVYKGRDLLKVEARDRNPYVAIKVLNDDFKKRDDAFIVLQREASRQQRLAHPNIVTVFDFDRTGDTIFISMELIEGTPLDTFLKADGRLRRGVPLPEALRLIEGMSSALMYAHEHGIVHADFKPSNCFVTHDGKIKVLDFGIARAVKRPDQQDGDVTVYDGASLGALTPAYASPEMVEGSAPADQRDDIYGLACVCYELLTGSHPFNRISARDARTHKLKPKKIEGLTSRQNRALAHALAFDREARTPTVREFIAELKGRTNGPSLWNKKTAGIAAVVVLLFAIGGAWYVFKYPVTRAIADLESGDRQRVQGAIEQIETFSPEDRVEALATARPAVIEHYRGQVQGLLDTDQFASADAMLTKGLEMYPGAEELVRLQGDVKVRKDRYLSELADQYETYLAAGRLRSDQRGDIQGVIERIRRVDPTHPLLKDPRVAGKFAEAADAAIDAGNLERARALIADGTKLAPNDDVLRNVADRLADAERQDRIMRRSAELAAQIESQLGTLNSLDKLAPVANDLVGLHDIDPSNALLSRVGSSVRGLLGRNYEVISAIATVDEAQAFERQYGTLFEALGLNDAAVRSRARRDTLVTRRDRLVAEGGQLAAAPGTRTASGASIGTVINELRALAPGDPKLDEIVRTAVAEQQNESQRLSAERKWNEARAALNAALALGVSAELRAAIEEDLGRIDQREREAARESMVARQEAARAAEQQRVATAVAQVRSALDGFSATPAGLQTLAARIGALAALDPGNAAIASTRAAAAQKVAAAANETAKAGRYDEAYALLARAAVDLPGAPGIATARTQVESLQADAAKQAQARAVAAAQETFRGVLQQPQPLEASWQRQAESALAALRRVAGDEAAAAGREQLAGVYLNEAGKFIDDKRFNVAAQLLDKAQQLTPSSAALQARRQQWTQASERYKSDRAAEELAARVEAAKGRFVNEVKAKQFDRARRTLSDLQTIASKNDPFVTREAGVMLNEAILTQAQARLNDGEIRGAWQLARSPGVPSEDPRFRQLLVDIDAAANRRIDTILNSQGAIDRASLSGLAEQYRTAAPDRYRALNPAWVATIRTRLGGLASDPAAHNAYLAAVQGAFTDVTALQSLRPIEIRAPAPAPSPAVVTATTPPSTAPAAVNNTTTPAAIPATVTPQPQVTSPPVAATAFEPSLIGKWCGDTFNFTFGPTSYSFELPGRTVTYAVERYQRNDNLITMSWTDKTIGPMMTQFGEFSTDGKTMVYQRGKKAASANWESTYNRRFRRCD